ncbi:DUF2919 domain-containing protein [Salmonella enterica]|nr:DUF2919 domain-containing protein [Salmonella enterica]
MTGVRCCSISCWITTWSRCCSGDILKNLLRWYTASAGPVAAKQKPEIKDVTGGSIMTIRATYRASDFDNDGLLKAPVLFWVGIVVLARAWWLAGLVSMMDASGHASAGVLWPGLAFQCLALAAGVPGMVMLFIYPLRGRWPGLSRANYVLILAALFVMTVTELSGLISVSPGQWEAGWMFLCLDVACMVMLWPDQRLRTVFFGDGLWQPVNHSEYRE